MRDKERLPTFIIGGAPRSGTTYLAEVLDNHPEIFVAKPFIPEPKVFVGPILNAAAYRARYAQMFSAAKGGQALGEKTSYYLENEQACRLIKELLPGIRMIFIVREPVARAYSNYLWSMKNGLESLSFEDALELEGRRASPLPPEQDYARPYDYMSRGDYATFALRYFETLGRDKVAFFLFEDLFIRPEQLFREVQEFIGVEPATLHRVEVKVTNSARHMGPPLDPDLKMRLKRRMQGYVERFRELVGLDVGPWGYDGL